MHASMLPDAVRMAFYLAGVVPVFIAGLDAAAYLSAVAKSGGRELLLINADLDEDELAAIADQTLAAQTERLSRALQAQE